MSRFFSYLQSSEKILQHYTGNVPFTIYLKQFFAQRKEMGSRDRKVVSQLCYQYFRLGHFKKEMPLYQRIVLAARCSPAANAQFLQAVDPEWQDDTPFSASDNALAAGITADAIFPLMPRLSSDIDGGAFAWSMLRQPHLFLRLRPGQKQMAMRKLERAALPFVMHGNNCVQLENASKADEVFAMNVEAVVQDRSSQQTGELLLELLNSIKTQQLNVWDCCAASGGKSIMLADTFEKIKLTVSDIRESILANLKSRFSEAGIRAQQSFVADLTKPATSIPNAPFDIVVADVPCTGSGTWARTPEQLFYFDEKEIEVFTAKQFSIASNASNFLKPGGYLVYITCSVFADENEKLVSKLAEQKQLNILHSACITGYEHGADTMFMALLQKED